ncbi:hypothetical protein H5410_044390 [Solanum commersonii]|uniref:Transcription factor n=1 Tax=Solanum commersonii TaxID=4109 RepID=A0A9J5X9R4_SOLCO|nr:hypothetical protein H5410_044390 [Solanum commersonii]
MQVPGLTKIQIGSHLQKCRRNNWRSPKEQRYVCLPSGQGSSNDSHEPKSTFPKYGAMPLLQTNVLNLQCNPDEIQKQHETLFGISGSQELQGSINGNTNYRPGLTFNSGDHDHAQCAYNLNLNATYGATYSSSRIVSDIDIENVSINQYNLNVNAYNVTICSDKTMMSDMILMLKMRLLMD